MVRPVELYLISGFLGAGKTTFLQAMMESFSAQRLGVLVNEFGSIGVDGALVDKAGIKLVEINNGSIFCACIKDGFVRTLKAFSQQPIDTLLIESSGMADPAGMNALLENLSPYLSRQYRYRGCVCLVDCTTFLDYIDTLLPMQGQVAAADLILVNKTDLAGNETLDEIHRRIRELNETAPIYNTCFARLPKHVMDEHLSNHGFSGTSSNTMYNRPAVYTIYSNDVFEARHIVDFHKALSKKTLRLKGFVRSSDGWLHVDGVTEQLTLSSADFEQAAPDEGRLVLIAKDGGDIAAEIHAAYARFCPGGMKLEAT